MCELVLAAIVVIVGVLILGTLFRTKDAVRRARRAHEMVRR